MGHRQSKTQQKNYYKILNINEDASLNELKQQYYKLLFKHHPNVNREGSNDKVLEIKEAYTHIFNILMAKEKEVDFEKYNIAYLENLKTLGLFYKEIGSLFSKISNLEDATTFPIFGDAESADGKSFYRFYEHFKTKRILFNEDPNIIRDKKIKFKMQNRMMQKEYEKRVRELAQLVKKLDDRMLKKRTKLIEEIIEDEYVYEYKTEEENKPIAKKIIDKEDNKKVEICNFCKKGFKSLNQKINHLKSKKHFERIKQTIAEAEDFIAKEIEENEALNKKEDKCTEDYVDKDLAQEINDKLNIESKQNEEKPNEELEDKKNVKSKAFKHFKNKKGKIKGPKQMRKIKKNKHHEPKELTLFLICNNCKKTFNSRNTLFLHLKDCKIIEE